MKAIGSQWPLAKGESALFSIPPWTAAQAVGVVSMWRSLLKLATPRKYPRQAIIFSQGENERDMFLIARGLAKVVVCGPDGQESIVALRYPGQFLEYSFCKRNMPYQVSAMTLVPSDIYRVDRRELQDAHRNNPDIGVLEIEVLSHELYTLADKHLAFKFCSPTDRLETLLWELATVLDGLESDRKAHLVLPLDNVDMAALCGVSESHYKAIRRSLEQTGRLRRQDRRRWLLSR